MRSKRFLVISPMLIASAFLLAASAHAQSQLEFGKLQVHVSPKQAYVFVDGKAVRDGSQTIDLAAGEHKVGVYNSGFVPDVQQVHVGAGETTKLDVTLQSTGDDVSGPFADIEFKGDPRAAVLLNGKTPRYFVGHVDEFNWDWIWHQRLLVRPGTYQVTVTHGDQTIWSGPVTAKAGQHVTVYLDQNGRQKVQNWSKGLTMSPQPPFHAGIASATVPVEPVLARISAQSRQLSCGQSTSLHWKAEDSVDTSISGLGAVPEKGQRTVDPKKTTEYSIVAKGPGGTVTKTVKVTVDSAPDVNLSLSKSEVEYHKIGDKVVQQGSALLTWSARNTNSVTVEPFDSHAESGSRSVSPDPKQIATGPVNEDVTYAVTSANACGGTVTKTATLHVVGSIDPPPSVTLASMFFPTAYPTRRHDVGLIASEKATLHEIAKDFRNRQKYDDGARLVIVGHADVRGPKMYNQKLSARRAELVQNYLVAQGVPAQKIKTRAEGKDDQLAMDRVQQLQSRDQQKPESWMARNKKATWLAYNRRADIILEPVAQQSKKIYPNDAAHARLLWQLRQPSLKKIMMAERQSASAGMNAATSTLR